MRSVALATLDKLLDLLSLRLVLVRLAVFVGGERRHLPVDVGEDRCAEEAHRDGVQLLPVRDWPIDKTASINSLCKLIFALTVYHHIRQWSR